MKHKITVVYVHGNTEVYYVDDFTYAGEELTMRGVTWRDKDFADVGIIPSRAFYALWINPVVERVEALT